VNTVEQYAISCVRVVYCSSDTDREFFHMHSLIESDSFRISKNIWYDKFNPLKSNSSNYYYTLPYRSTPCLKKLCKIVFVRTLSNFHQFW